MRREDISAFKMRITQGNKSEIIVVLYDIFFCDLKEAAEHASAGEGWTADLRHASLVVEHLKQDLNFQYDISRDLLALYLFVQKQLSRAIYKNDIGEAEPAKDVMLELRDAFAEVAKQDDSGPMMKNAQSVVAGYTYGRTDINEAAADYDVNRGFLA